MERSGLRLNCSLMQVRKSSVNNRRGGISNFKKLLVLFISAQILSRDAPNIKITPQEMSEKRI